jgi:hypothetical protein
MSSVLWADMNCGARAASLCDACWVPARAPWRDWGRPRVRFWVRLRVRFLGRLKLQRISEQLPCLTRSSAGFPGWPVCEESTSAGNGAFLRGLSRRLRLSGPVAGGAALASCRWPSAMTVAAGGALPAALRGEVTVGAYIVLADRVVASRRLLLCFARLGRPRSGSACCRGCATVWAWTFAAATTPVRRRAGRWGYGRRSAEGGAR